MATHSVYLMISDTCEAPYHYHICRMTFIDIQSLSGSFYLFTFQVLAANWTLEL